MIAPHKASFFMGVWCALIPVCAITMVQRIGRGDSDWISSAMILGLSIVFALCNWIELQGDGK